MNTFRFKLDPYKGQSSRHTCPSCNKKRCFVRYIDTEDRISFPNNVGRCNREEKCGYHFTPKQYFQDNSHLMPGKDDISTKSTKISNKEQSINFIDKNLLNNSLIAYKQNNLYQFLCHQIGEKETLELFKTYMIGTSKVWDGATIFWQVDTNGKVRTGKIMQYSPKTGKRVKRPFNHISWVHFRIHSGNFNLKQCFFGEHLLSADNTKPVGIVESEKSALISAHYLPHYKWIASGGKYGCLNSGNYKTLLNHKVVLFPDSGAFKAWYKKAKSMKRYGIDVSISNTLENSCTLNNFQTGYDIADYLLDNLAPADVTEKMIKQNPALKTLIDTFELVPDDSFKTEIIASFSHKKQLKL